MVELINSVVCDSHQDQVRNWKAPALSPDFLMFDIVFKNSFKLPLFTSLVLGAANAMGATPTLQGQSGYINMPSAWVEPDGTFSAGYSYDSPYGSTWFSATVLPFLQMTGRYVSITGTPAF
jgi:hypothetical protein